MVETIPNTTNPAAVDLLEKQRMQIHYSLLVFLLPLRKGVVVLMRPIVKICGMTRSDDIRMCIHYGAKVIGIVVEYPEPVPWSVDVCTAGELVAACGDTAKSCIVSDGSHAKLVRLAHLLQPNYIQTSFGGAVEEIDRLVNNLQNCGATKLIVAISPQTPLEKTIELSKTGITALLLDPRTSRNAVIGGIAEPHRFKCVQDTVNCSVILAGGLNSSNIELMVRLSQAQMIDVMTGVEGSPGVKDESKVSSLFRNLPTLRLKTNQQKRSYLNERNL